MLDLFSKRMVNIGVILILLCLLSLQFFSAIQPPNVLVWERSAPLAHAIYLFLGNDLLQSSILDFILATPLVLFQVILVYNLISKIKNFEKHALLITWLYTWLLHLFPYWTKFSPPLMAVTLLLFILYRVYTHIELNKDSFIFTVGSLVGISFLLWYPSIFILLFIIILLFQYNELSFKRGLILFLSFIIPIIWFSAIYLVQGNGTALLYRFATFHISSIHFHEFRAIQFIPISIILLSIFIGWFQAMSFSTKTSKMARLFINSILSLIFCLALGVIVSINAFHYSFAFLLFPFAIFLALFINIFKRPILAELAHIILILAVICNFAYISFS